MKIVLGSQSPRRKELLEHFLVPFIQVPSDFDEESVPYAGNPGKHAMLLSKKKNEALAEKFQGDVILTADSVVFCNGNLYNKPRDEEEAFSFLTDFSNQWQSVFTGVTASRGPLSYTDVEETRLLFNPLSEEQIRLYHRHGYFLDKAGGYTIEKTGNLVVSRIEGCYDNIVGLPLNTTRKLLLKVGVDLWDFLK